MSEAATPTSRNWSARLSAAVLVIGVAICAAWLWRAWSRGHVVWHLTPGLLTGLMLAWAAMVLFSTGLWRYLLARVAGIRVDWAEGLTHTGTLLVGKYVPGGVFGLLGRGLHLRAHGRDREVIAVSLIEQWVVLHVGVVLVALLWLWPLTIAGAIAALVALIALGRAVLGAMGAIVAALSRRWPRLGRYVEPLRVAGQIGARDYAVAMGLQGGVWLLLAAFALLCAAIHGIALDGALALLLTRAFFLSVVVGTLAIFAPGGIGVREFTFAALAGSALGGVERAGELVLLIRVANALGDLATGALAAALYARGATRRA